MEENKNALVSAFGKQKRWVNWKYEKIDGKETKVPYQVNGWKASTTNPLTWSTYEEAIKVSPNVGIVFTSDQLLLGIDIDHCLENVKIVHEKHTEIGRLIAETSTYFEVSPSGTGLHGFLILTAPLKLLKNKKAPFELYNSNRYFTVTTKPYGEALPIRTVTPEDAVALLSVIGYPWEEKRIEQNDPIKEAISSEDEIIIGRMFSSKNGSKIKSLYGGDISNYKNDDSLADMALCMHLAFWTGKNADQIERIWLNSPLGAREKTRSRGDYRKQTINKAIGACKKTYSPKKQKEKKEELPPRERIHKFEKPEKETSFEDWKKIINKNFPDLLLAAEMAGSTLSQILITDITNPFAGVLVDVPSSGKTIAVNFYSDIPELTYPTDKFTPASFVSNAANVEKEKLKDIDLLPRIQYKMLMIRDLSILFSKRDDDLNECLGILTRVLDGEGLNTDSGVHGSRQYNGEYLFMLLAATTPVPHKVWKMMGTLGSRLFFLKMHSRNKNSEELVGQLRSLAYKEKEKECRLITRNFMQTLWYKHRDGVLWDKSKDDERALRIISRCAQMLAKFRGVVHVWDSGFDTRYETPVVEKPDRINQLFYNLARGHALLCGRTQINYEDLKLIMELTIDSMPNSRSNLLEKILDHGGAMSTTEIEEELNCSKPTALKEMNILTILGICSTEKEGSGLTGGQEKEIQLTEDFTWLLSEECAFIRGHIKESDLDF